MIEEIEISSLDLQFESYRLKDKAAERALLTSILEKGVREPLQGANTQDRKILLNGFKRYRCAKKLGISIVPYLCLAEDQANGIMELLRLSNSKSLNIMEEAKLIDELKNVHQMSTADIAIYVVKSKAWVSVRTGIIQEMSQNIIKKVFSGQFPVYAYMYILRPFIRINGHNRKEVDDFVDLVSGKDLSIRDIKLLAHEYFNGSDEFRREVKKMNISWALKSMRDTYEKSCECAPFEQSMIKDLELAQKYIRRVTCKINDTRYKSNTFFVQANLLSSNILSQLETFNQALKRFYDKTSKA